MKRRDLIAAALTASPMLLSGCANLAAPAPTATGPAQTQITVLFDAFGSAPGLTKDWGYAALVEVGGQRILFDTGKTATSWRKTPALWVWISVGWTWW